MIPSYDDLCAENAYLKARLAEFTDTPMAARLQNRLTLTGKEAAVLVCLMGRPLATKAVIHAQAFEHDNGDGPDPKIVDVFICKIRKKATLQKWPGQIATVWGQGYRMDDAMKAFLRDAAGETEPQQALAA